MARANTMNIRTVSVYPVSVDEVSMRQETTAIQYAKEGGCGYPEIDLRLAIMIQE